MNNSIITLQHLLIQIRLLEHIIPEAQDVNEAELNILESVLNYINFKGSSKDNARQYVLANEMEGICKT